MTRPYYSNSDLAGARARAHEATRHVYVELASEDDIHAGLGWYLNAHDVIREISDTSGYSLDTVAGVMAIVSPRTQWAQNITCAKMICSDDAKGARGYAIGSFVDKAVAWRNGKRDVMGGQKVLSFYDNLLNPTTSEAVTLDYIMAKGIGFEQKALERKGFAEAVTKGVQDAARELGIRPCQLQAICWVYWRGREG